MLGQLTVVVVCLGPEVSRSGWNPASDIGCLNAFKYEQSGVVLKRYMVEGSPGTDEGRRNENCMRNAFWPQ